MFVLRTLLKLFYRIFLFLSIIVVDLLFFQPMHFYIMLWRHLCAKVSSPLLAGCLVNCVSWPVKDAFAVQEHERGGDLCCVETCPWLFEFPGLLDVEHEIATVHKLHHKEQTVLKKEARGWHLHMCTETTPALTATTPRPLLNSPTTHDYEDCSKDEHVCFS